MVSLRFAYLRPVLRLRLRQLRNELLEARPRVGIYFDFL
jgi:hypothetical protein